MSLKKMYDDANVDTMDNLIEYIINKVSTLIVEHKTLPFFLNDLDTGYVNKNELKDKLLENHGVHVSFFPSGVVIDNFVDVSDNI